MASGFETLGRDGGIVRLPDFESLAAAWRDGQVASKTLMRRAGEAGWVEAATLPEIGVLRALGGVTAER